jgi:4-hydroxy-tetrahydrodipicolinate reductase
MGRAIISTCQGRAEVQVVVALERTGSDFIGVDAGELAGVGNIEVPVTDNLSAADFDVLIDFTNPAATVQHVQSCAAGGQCAVIGTTGLSDSDRQQIDAATARVAIMLAPNMSVGVNLCLHLLQIAAQTIGDDTDIEIIEAHHRHKVDAPSGTALRMGEVIAAALGVDLSERAVYARQGAIGARPSGAIGFSTIRAGEIVGDHTVMFASAGERIEISHHAASRETFAGGAVRAARWIVDQPPGLYDMQDVLGLR